MNERELARKFVQDGDEAAFRALYRLHTPVIYRVTIRMVREPEVAAEVVQDTWIRAAQKLPMFRWESRLQTWLVAIAINRCREEVRRRSLAENASADGIENATHPIPLNARIDLERALARLPEGYREILLLHDVEGYTHEEIGQALEIEPGTSRSQLTRARAAMREWLEQRKENYGKRTG